LKDPSGLFIDRAGVIFVAERRNHVIRRIEGNRVTRLAGTGRSGFTGDGCCAAFVRLRFPEGLAADDAGNLFVADSGNHRVRRISPNGTIETVAGIGRPGYSGDGGPATEATIATPSAVALGPAGDIFIADYGNHRIRRIASDGTIETVAGNGESGFSGDGGLARLASLNGPYGIFVDGDGVLYIADSGNNRVRRVLSDGTIATIAGTGESGFGGDGGPATAGLLDSPQAVTTTPAGEVIINDEHNHRIRKILPAGMIVTIAGNGEPRLCGDGGPASEACLNDPEHIYLDDAGNLFLTDGDNYRLRRVSPDGIITTIAGSDPSGRRAK
jgi:sugar lactone lactonase YvrE